MYDTASLARYLMVQMYRPKVPENPPARQGKGGVPHATPLRYRHTEQPSVLSFPEPKHRLKHGGNYGIPVQEHTHWEQP